MLLFNMSKNKKYIVVDKVEAVRKFGIVLDCHNTIVDSNIAWTKAFMDYVDQKYENDIMLDLFGRRLKRRFIAQKYGVDYDSVEKKSYTYSKLNSKIFSLIQIAYENNIPLFVVSNAPLKNVVEDLKNVHVISFFKRIYAKENGGKQNLRIFDCILSDYDLDFLIFIGNEEFDDNILHPYVLSVAITDFLLQRFSIIKNMVVNDMGRIE